MVEAEENRRFLEVMRRKGIGTAEMEAVIQQQLKMKKVRDDKYKRRKELLNTLFGEKLDDAKAWEREQRKKRNRKRKEIEERMGKKSKTYDRLISEIKDKTKRTRTKKRQEYEKKAKWLENKYRRRAEEQDKPDLPRWLEKYQECKIFMKACNMMAEQVKGPVLVEEEGKPIPFSENEKKALSLGPKFCVFEKEDLEEFLSGIEISLAKYKWDKINDDETDEDEEDNFTEEEKEEHARIGAETIRIEAQSRTIYLKEEKTFDYSRKRATDMKNNAKVYLPKALKVEEEAALEALRQEWLQVYKNHFQTAGKQEESNLTSEEKDGIKSIRKRRKEGEIVIVPTDKSNRFSVMTLDTYLKAGKVHTNKDKEITAEEVKQNQNEVNGHVSMGLKIFRVAGSRGQED